MDNENTGSTVGGDKLPPNKLIIKVDFNEKSLMVLQEISDMIQHVLDHLCEDDCDSFEINLDSGNPPISFENI